MFWEGEDRSEQRTSHSRSLLPAWESSELHSWQSTPGFSSKISPCQGPCTLAKRPLPAQLFSHTASWPSCDFCPLGQVEFWGLLRMTMPIRDLKTNSYTLKSTLSQVSPSKERVGQPLTHHCHTQVILLWTCAHQPSNKENPISRWNCLCAWLPHEMCFLRVGTSS